MTGDRWRKFRLRLIAGYYGALVAFAVISLIFDLSPAIPGWVLIVAVCAPIALVLLWEM